VRRIALLALVAAAVAVPVAAEAAAPVKHYAQPGTLGFYRGQTIEYLDLGPVKLAPGNKTAPIWVVANGPDAQLNVVDTVPGRRDYSPLWAVRMVTWKDGVAPRLLTSAAAIRRAAARGDVTIQAAPVVVNCPVL
jgi:hypothetical protein